MEKAATTEPTPRPAAGPSEGGQPEVGAAQSGGGFSYDLVEVWIPTETLRFLLATGILVPGSDGRARWSPRPVFNPVDDRQLSTGGSKRPGDFASPPETPSLTTSFLSSKKSRSSRKTATLPNIEETSNSGESRGGAEWREAREVAGLLVQSIQREHPWFQTPPERVLTRWTVDIEKVARLDGHPWPVIRQVVEWIGGDGRWWTGHVQSGERLRQKFGVLRAQVERKAEPSGKITASELIDRARKL